MPIGLDPLLPGDMVFRLGLDPHLSGGKHSGDAYTSFAGVAYQAEDSNPVLAEAGMNQYKT